MTTTYDTDSRPTYTGERSKWTAADGTYSLHVCVPTKGRTFLFDMSDDSPSAEFERIVGKRPSGMVGSAEGQSAFLLHAEFPAESDADAVAFAQRVMDTYEDAICARVFYVVPEPFGSSSEKVADL